MSNATADIDSVYEDRNLAAMAFAALIAAGTDPEPPVPAGWYVPGDDGYDDWPVVWFIPDPDVGQVSYHVPPEDREILDESPVPNREPPGGYDGHTKADVHDRLRRFITLAGRIDE